MDDEGEILVHVSAPATKHNHDIYYSLAEAYSHFEPIQSTVQTEDCFVPAHETPNEPAATNATTSKDSYGSFPSQIDSGDYSGRQNHSSIRHAFTSSEEDLSLPTSRLAQLERMQTKWRDQRTPRPSLAGGQHTKIDSPTTSGNVVATFIEDTQQALQAFESQIWEQFSTTSEDTSDDAEDSGVGHIALIKPAGNAQAEMHLPTGASMDLPSAKSPQCTRGFETGLSSSPAPLQSATPDMVVHNETFVERSHTILQVSPPACTPKPRNFQGLPVIVTPPAPTVTVDSPGILPSQITKYLEMMKLQNPDRFKPLINARPLLRDERGHWVVSCSMLPQDTQYEFWMSLQDSIRSGRLGWGVTLHREVAHSHDLGTFRLYCWGEIAEHTWLFLWLSSKGKVCGLGTKWVDADDIVVMEMA